MTLTISGSVLLINASYWVWPVELLLSISGESAENIALMECIDKEFVEWSEMGIRWRHQEISTPSNPINIKRVHRLMWLMGLEAVYQKPNLSKPAEGHQIYPYLLRGVVIDQPNQVILLTFQWTIGFVFMPHRRTDGDRTLQRPGGTLALF